MNAIRNRRLALLLMISTLFMIPNLSSQETTHPSTTLTTSSESISTNATSVTSTIGTTNTPDTTTIDRVPTTESPIHSDMVDVGSQVYYYADTYCNGSQYDEIYLLRPDGRITEAIYDVVFNKGIALIPCPGAPSSRNKRQTSFSEITAVNTLQSLGLSTISMNEMVWSNPDTTRLLLLGNIVDGNSDADSIREQCSLESLQQPSLNRPDCVTRSDLTIRAISSEGVSEINKVITAIFDDSFAIESIGTERSDFVEIVIQAVIIVQQPPIQPPTADSTSSPPTDGTTDYEANILILLDSSEIHRFYKFPHLTFDRSVKVGLCGYDSSQDLPTVAANQPVTEPTNTSTAASTIPTSNISPLPHKAEIRLFVDNESQLPTFCAGAFRLENTDLVLEHVHINATPWNSFFYPFRLCGGTITGSNVKISREHTPNEAYIGLIQASSTRMSFTDSEFVYGIDSGTMFLMVGAELSLKDSVYRISGTNSMAARSYLSSLGNRIDNVEFISYGGKSPSVFEGEHYRNSPLTVKNNRYQGPFRFGFRINRNDISPESIGNDWTHASGSKCDINGSTSENEGLIHFTDGDTCPQIPRTPIPDKVTEQETTTSANTPMVDTTVAGSSAASNHHWSALNFVLTIMIAKALVQ